MPRTIHCEGSASLVGIISETNIYVDDVPDHKLQLIVQMFDHTCTCEEIGEFRQIVRGYYDVVGQNASAVGYYTNHLKGGDKIFGTWTGKQKTEIEKDGSWEISLSGEWVNTGGTGEFEGAKGKGPFSMKVSPAALSFEWEGDFEFPD